MQGQVHSNMKVLRIWHAAVVTEYRKKIQALAQVPGVELTLLVPPAWREGGKEVRYQYDDTIDSAFRTVVGKIINQNNIRRYVFLTGLFRTLQEVRPDLIDLEEEPFSFVLAQVILFCNMLGLAPKIVFHSAHNISRRMGRGFEFIQQIAFRRCAAAVIRNSEVEINLRQHGFPGVIVKSGNGIDLTHFTPGVADQLKRQLGWIDKTVIGFVGKLKTGKGVLDLLDAFAQQPENTVLLLVGDGHLRDEILARAHEQGIEQRIHLTGAVQHQHTPDYYRLMDVCVLPSRTETRWKESFGRTLVEAMACGIPVIGSSSGAIPETISNAGAIFPEGDIGQLVNRIHELIANPPLRHQLIQNGLARAQNFTWEAIAQKNYQAYVELMKSA
jgi:glycosyltransferase involved in cell wall biosynthesis